MLVKCRKWSLFIRWRFKAWRIKQWRFRLSDALPIDRYLLNNVADGGSVDTVDHGGRVVGLPVGEDPSVGTLEDDGQAPPDVAQMLNLNPPKWRLGRK